MSRVQGFIALTFGPLLPASLAVSQCEGLRLTEPAVAMNGRYGSAVALEDQRAYVVASLDSDRGSLFVYERDQDDWPLVQHIRGLDLPGSFPAISSVVAVEADTLILGDPGNSHAGSGSGAVHVLRLVGGAWQFDQTVFAQTTSFQHHFGESVALEDDWMVVGAPHADPGPQDGSGRAYVFRRSGDSWIESDELRALDAADGDFFGTSVAVSGERVVVGAPYAGLHGKAYVFEYQAPDWHEVASVEGDGFLSAEGFGTALSLQGDTLVVGSPYESTAGFLAGMAYVFERSNGAWTKTQELTPAQLSPEDRFGTTVQLEGERLLVTAQRNKYAFLFERVAGTWQLARLHEYTDTYPSPQFGGSAALAGDTVLVGAPFRTPNGSAYLFQLAWLTSTYCYCDQSEPCGNATAWSGCANSTGVGGRLRTCGTTSTSTDDLVLLFESLPPGQTLLAWNGGDVTQIPFGDGQRCVAPGSAGIFRFQPPLHISGGGTATLGPGIVAHSHAAFPSAGHLEAGDTWYFQGWYRDPAGPCGSGFNLTNGLRATFAP